MTARRPWKCYVCGLMVLYLGRHLEFAHGEKPLMFLTSSALTRKP